MGVRTPLIDHILWYFIKLQTYLQYNLNKRCIQLVDFTHNDLYKYGIYLCNIGGGQSLPLTISLLNFKTPPLNESRIRHCSSPLMFTVPLSILDVTARRRGFFFRIPEQQ
jgi:hypothetical protein